MATNLEKLAEATGAEPVVAFSDDGKCAITVRYQGAALTASGNNPPEAARRLLDGLGVE